LDAVIADGTWSQLYTDWVPRPLPQAGSRDRSLPRRRTCRTSRRIAEHNHRGETAGAAQPKSTLAQLRDQFFDWELYKQAIPAMVTTGLPNTLILTVSAS